MAIHIDARTSRKSLNFLNAAFFWPHLVSCIGGIHGEHSRVHDAHKNGEMNRLRTKSRVRISCTGTRLSSDNRCRIGKHTSSHQRWHRRRASAASKAKGASIRNQESAIERVAIWMGSAREWRRGEETDRVCRNLESGLGRGREFQIPNSYVFLLTS
jgi:hypothetical protein